MNILVIDVGTSSMRGLLFNGQGQVMYKKQREYGIDTVDNITVEQDPAVLKDSLYTILAAAGEYSKQNSLPIGAVSVTAQRSSVVAVSKDGEPLCRFMMWQDKRSAELCDEMNEKLNDIYPISGMRVTPVFSAPKMLWMKRNKPEIYEKAYKLMGIHEYILFLLTGEFVTDTSIASRTSLFDVSKLIWSDKLLTLFGIDEEKLCRIVPVGSVCGKTKALDGLPEGLPVVSAGGDQQCAALGLGIVKEGSMEVNSGTGSFIIALSDQPLFDPDQRLICNVSAIPGKWIVEGATLAAGIAVKWMNKQFFADYPDQAYPFERFDQECLQSPPGANGVIFTPSFAGKGAPYWDPYARATLHNVGFNNSRADFARALLEGIIAEMNDCLGTITKLFHGTEFHEVRCAGGLTKSALFNQIQSDMYNRTVVRPQNEEATGLGGWISAAVTLGQYPGYEEAFHTAVDESKSRKFTPNQKNHELYQRMNTARAKIYESLNMREICGILAGGECSE